MCYIEKTEYHEITKEAVGVQSIKKLKIENLNGTIFAQLQFSFSLFKQSSLLKKLEYARKIKVWNMIMHLMEST